MQLNNYFTYSEYPDKKGKVFIAVEHYSADHQKVIGVITGAESVCVVGSGLGVSGDIRQLVEDILGTDKTVECVSLSGAPQETGASALFDIAYLNPDAQAVYEASATPETRLALLEKLCEGNEETMAYGRRVFLDNSGIHFLPLGDGMGAPWPTGNDPHMYDKFGDGYLFHLGGTVVEMAAMPAQYDDQLIAVCSTCCISFTGKAIEEITHLESRDRSGLETYVKYLDKFVKYVSGPTDYDEGMGYTPHVFFSDSSSVPMGLEVAENILQACREVLAGETGYDMPAGADPDLRIHFVKNNGIVYSAAKLG